MTLIRRQVADNNSLLESALRSAIGCMPVVASWYTIAATWSSDGSDFWPGLRKAVGVVSVNRLVGVLFLHYCVSPAPTLYPPGLPLVHSIALNLILVGASLGFTLPVRLWISSRVGISQVELRDLALVRRATTDNSCPWRTPSETEESEILDEDPGKSVSTATSSADASTNAGSSSMSDAATEMQMASQPTNQHTRCDACFELDGYVHKLPIKQTITRVPSVGAGDAYHETYLFDSDAVIPRYDGSRIAVTRIDLACDENGIMAFLGTRDRIGQTLLIPIGTCMTSSTSTVAARTYDSCSMTSLLQT